jgi:hypothetical protein
VTRPQPWEYHLEPAAALDGDRLDALGRDGWELVTIDPASGSAIFKRPGPNYRERITLAQRERVAGEMEDAGDEA